MHVALIVRCIGIKFCCTTREAVEAPISNALTHYYFSCIDVITKSYTTNIISNTIQKVKFIQQVAYAWSTNLMSPFLAVLL